MAGGISAVQQTDCGKTREASGGRRAAAALLIVGERGTAWECVILSGEKSYRDRKERVPGSHAPCRGMLRGGTSCMVSSGSGMNLEQREMVDSILQRRARTVERRLACLLGRSLVYVPLALGPRRVHRTRLSEVLS